MIKKTPLLYSAIIFFFSFWANEKIIGQEALSDNRVELISIFSKCTESVALYEFDGADFSIIQEISNFDQDTFRFQVPASTSRFYYVGTRSGRKRPVILGQQKEVVVVGHCNNPRQAKFKNSPINTGYDELLQSFNTWNGATRKAARSLQTSGGNKEKIEAAIQEFANIDQEKRNRLDSLQKKQPYLRKVAVLNTYLSFQNNNNGRFQNEIEYFGNTYFELADFSDSDYNHIPYLFEAFKTWSKVLAQQRIPETMLRGLLDGTLDKFPADGRAIKYALGGVVNSLQSTNNPLFEEYGARYLALFEDQNIPALAAMKKRVDMAKNFLTGAVAPDFGQPTPEGDTLMLSDLRGKIVLVDFWASWCGPCRRENPNVIKVYEKYKDKGFDVLGVSLDRSKDPWLKAIKKDQLPWHQISDLRGWKNEVAQLYSISSIPHTMLVDREGKIIARNLRGPQLEAALKEIFKE
ncbi:MAG: TlpA family protein disulfide reductase [Saprospiraceae bacterium]